jgi:hypothetical protein
LSNTFLTGLSLAVWSAMRRSAMSVSSIDTPTSASRPCSPPDAHRAPLQAFHSRLRQARRKLDVQITSTLMGIGSQAEVRGLRRIACRPPFEFGG